MSERLTKYTFIIAIVYLAVFLGVTAFVLVYCTITESTVWKEFQSFFTPALSIATGIIGYFLKSPLTK